MSTRFPLGTLEGKTTRSRNSCNREEVSEMNIEPNQYLVMCIISLDSFVIMKVRKSQITTTMLNVISLDWGEGMVIGTRMRLN